MVERVVSPGMLATSTDYQQGELRKAVDAIYVYPQKGKLTLVSRKAFNLLLANAMEQGVDRDWYELSVSALAKDMRYDSNDMNHLENTLNSMQVTLLRWDALETIADKEVHVRDYVQLLGAIRFIGGVSENGTASGTVRTVRYQFDARVKQRLLVPEVYARINLQLQAEFKSSYTLALYEQLIRFKSNSAKDGWAYTVKLGWKNWRNFIVGGEYAGIYDEYKYFSRDVITKAIKELNDRVGDYEFECLIFKQGRSVTDLQFRLKRRAQQSLPLAMDQPIIDTEAITNRLLAFDLKPQEVTKLINTIELSILEQAAEDTETRLSRRDLNPIRNKPAYFADSLRRNRSSDGQPPARMIAEGDGKGKSAEGTPSSKQDGKAAKGQWGSVYGRFQELPADEQDDLLKQFLETVDNPAVVHAHAQKGLASSMVRGAFMPWLERNLEF